jgi:hypothetical protein
MFSSTKKNYSSKLGARKTKRQNLSKKNMSDQTGGGVFKIHPKAYTNIVYKKSGYNTSRLECLQCHHTIFRRHNATHESKLRDFMIESDVFSKKYNIFVCNNCGFMMNYSGDISYNSRQSSKR